MADYSDRPMMTGTFGDYEKADRAYADLRDRGYTDEDIHVIMSEDTKKHYYDRDVDQVEIKEGSKAMEGAGAGAAIGGTLIPGIGAIAGPIAGALAGAGAGGAAGSLVGALVGAGIPEETAHAYERDVKEGGVVVGVHPRDDDRDYVQSRYDEYGASNVYYNDPAVR